MALPKHPVRYGGVDGPVSTLGPNAGTLAVNGVATVPAYYNRLGLRITSDAAGTGTVYLLGGGGVPSATNFHVSLAPGGSWDGQVGQALWTGAVQLFSTAAIRVGVWEV